METIGLSFVIAAFVAGIITFLAPCTLPLVPGYLSFITGSGKTRSATFLNGFLYVIGFSVVFILFGTLFGLGGSFLFGFRDVLVRLGGVFVMIFGAFLLFSALAEITNGKVNIMKYPPFSFFAAERQTRLGGKLTPGKPVSSLLFGASFALGWSPCVGPILGAVLTLAAANATVGQGAFLLFVFSLGLAVPFLITAAFIGWVYQRISYIQQYLVWVSAAGGVFLIILGFMMITNNFLGWIGFVYQIFDAFGIQYEEYLLDFL